VRVSFLVGAGVVMFATAAVAAPEPIVVVSEDAAFRSALSAALAPAGMVIRIANDTPPSIADITSASRQLAEREQATSTVWLVFVGDGATLIAYDRGVDRVLVRSLPYAAPLSAPQAAEAARMTRTMLRALRVTPDSDLLPPSAEAAPAVRAKAQAQTYEQAIAPPAIAPPSAPRTLAIDVDGGVRMRGPGSDATLTGALGVIWRPDRLGIALTARFAPASDLTGAVMGRISDHSIAVTARLPLRVAPRIGVAATGGLAIHRIALDGTLGTEQVRDRRLDPAMRLGLVATYELSPAIALGFGMSADWLLRRQTYEAGPDEVLAVPLIQVAAGVVLVARIL